METSRNWIAWLVCAAFVTTSAWGQVFSHKHRGEHFEASVTADRIVIKERYKGATTIHGDLSCPLGSTAVRASLLPEAETKLCLTFSADECEYARYQNGNAIHKDELANARVPKMCIALASARDARQLVSLVNGTPYTNGHGAEAAPEASPPPPAAADVPSSDTARRIAPRPTAHAVQAPSGSTQSVEERTQSVEERTQSYSSSTAAAPPRANGTKHASRDTPLALFIHVRSAAQRAQAERLVKPLAARGIRVTGIRVIHKGPAATDLRYFYSGDAQNSAEVVRALRRLGVSAVEVKHIPGLETRATPRQYELWLAPPEDPLPSRRPPPRSRHGRAGLTRG
jgi:hypothetical protein